jgi:hypothetical protein
VADVPESRFLGGGSAISSAKKRSNRNLRASSGAKSVAVRTSTPPEKARPHAPVRTMALIASARAASVSSFSSACIIATLSAFAFSARSIVIHATSPRLSRTICFAPCMTIAVYPDNRLPLPIFLGVS